MNVRCCVQFVVAIYVSFGKTTKELELVVVSSWVKAFTSEKLP